MKGQVTRLLEADKVQLPAEMLSVSITPRQVEEEVHQLSMRYASQVPAQTVEPGDVVTCQPDPDAYADGRSILLYTGLDIPGAGAAAKAVLGKQAGDSLSVSLGEKQVTLTVKEIIRLAPADISDGLIASLKLEGVATVEDYRRYAAAMLKQRELDDKRKMAVGYVMERMLEGSEFSYDPAELEAYFAAHLEEIVAEYREYGMEGTEEDIRCDVLKQLEQGWMAEEICRRSGFEADMAAVEEEASQMLEMMTLMGETPPDRETLLEKGIRNMYIMEMFRQLENLVNEKMGG